MNDFTFFKNKFWENRNEIFEIIHNTLEKNENEVENIMDEENIPIKELTLIKKGKYRKNLLYMDTKNIEKLQKYNLYIIEESGYIYLNYYSELNKSNSKNNEGYPNNNKSNIIFNDNNSKNSNEKRKINYNEENEENIINTINKSQNSSKKNKNDVSEGNLSQIINTSKNSSKISKSDDNEDYIILRNNNSQNSSKKTKSNNRDEEDNKNNEINKIQKPVNFNNKEEKLNENKESKNSNKKSKISENNKSVSCISESLDSINLLQIDFLIQVNIYDQTEWICNTDYALYIIFYVYNLKNPYHRKSSIDSESLMISEKQDIENLLFRHKKNGKKIIDIKEDLVLSKFIKKFNKSNFQDNFILYSIKNKEEIKDYADNICRFNDISYFFHDLDVNSKYSLIFNHYDDLNVVIKMKELKLLYITKSIRYLYINIEAINNLKSIKEKVLYLSYFVLHIFKYGHYKDYQDFTNKTLNEINFGTDYITQLINKIIDKNKQLVKKYKNNIPELYIILDNMNDENDFKIWKYFFDLNLYDDNLFFIGVCNIDKSFNNELFFSVNNKPFDERRYGLYFLNSNNTRLNESLNNDLITFFKEIEQKKELSTFKDFIKIIHFQEYKNEKIDEINCKFLSKHMKFLNLNVSDEDNRGKLIINDVIFKNEEIKQKYENKFKALILYFLNNNLLLKDLFGGKDGDFFEKQLILDIITEKIKEDKILDFQELKINTIYCMNIEKEKIDFSKYNNKNIFFSQKSKTGEIYDFAFAINDYIKSFQASNQKSIKDLIKLSKSVIEVDCRNINHTLQNIKDYKKFSFGIITSRAIYEEYKSIPEKNRKNTTYYLMKEHCVKNLFEFIIYDLLNQKFFVEDDNGKLKEYENFYGFDSRYAIKNVELNEIFDLNPKKMTIKYVNKEKIFKNIESKEPIDIVGKFNFKKEFLNINMNEKNYGLLIYGNKSVFNDLLESSEEGNYSEVSFQQEIIKFNNQMESNFLPNIKDLSNIDNIKLKNPHVILFHTNGDIKFLKKKRSREKEKKRAKEKEKKKLKKGINN